MTDKPQRQPAGSAATVLCTGGLVIVLVAMGYALSRPPVELVIERIADNDACWAVCDAFYAPLAWLEERSALVKSFYDWYYARWGIT